AFGVEYLAEDGSSQVPLMGCYGIGVERTVAAVIEQNHDKDGIIWPSSIAPFHVHLLPVKYEGEVKEFSMKLYEQLNASGIEILLDDRDERPGVKFKDADLIGIPIRITIGEKNLKQGIVEIKERRNKETRLIDSKEITTLLRKMVSEDLQKYR
ncbi:MAG: proline--tRNA ligase, partial [Spirochaetota bacterium]